MSLTSYRAAPLRVRVHRDGMWREQVTGWTVSALSFVRVVGGPGGDLLSHVLRRSTIGAEGFHGRVRDGIGCGPLAVTTRSTNRPAGCRPTLSCRVRMFEDVMRLTDACLRSLVTCLPVGLLLRGTYPVSEIKPIERLVRLSFTRCRASTRLLSTGWSVPALGECWF